MNILPERGKECGLTGEWSMFPGDLESRETLSENDCFLLSVVESGGITDGLVGGIGKGT